MASVRAKRNVIAILIVLVGVLVFGWMFWMIGEAAYNLSVPNGIVLLLSQLSKTNSASRT